MNSIQRHTVAKARDRFAGRLIIAALVTALLFCGTGAARSQTAFITSATLGTTRNDFNGWLGMKFTVGASPITVVALGRMCLTSNSGTHPMKLIAASSGANVPNGAVSISLASGTAGQFVYGSLANPVTLSANTAYYLVSQETPGGDRWATEYTTVMTTPVASCDGAILSNSSAWSFRPPANTSFVPLNFKYAPANVAPIANITSPADGATFTAPANMMIHASASDTDGSVVSVRFFEGANSIGIAGTSPYSIPWNNVSPGAYALTVKATDNLGATTTSSAINIVVTAPPVLSGSPANDSFANAQVISGIAGVAYTVNGSNVNGTKEPGEPFHVGNVGGRSVWYQWTAPTSNQSLFNTIGSDFDTLLAIYVGNGVSALNLVASNDNIDQSTPQSRLSFTSVAGTTYWIAVDGFNGASGNIVLRWEQAVGPPPPANDGFATAPMISGSVGSFNSSSANATKEPGEPNHVGYPGGASVWYQWMAPTANPATFDTFGSAYDTLLAVYTGNSVANLSPVASNNDVDSVTRQSRVSFAPVAGAIYYIAIDGISAASGNFVLSWNQSSLGNLPDLIIWVNSATNYIITNESFLSTDCAVVEGLVQSGSRRLLRFTTETRNIGTVDWWMGNPAGNPSFVYAPCHGHYHFNGFMQYRLLNSNGQLVSPGAKVGFCLTDSLRWDSS
ncbi:MAG: Ig-like domain-containing protein, partial [Verrucomicrobiota bacterium]